MILSKHFMIIGEFHGVDQSNWLIHSYWCDYWSRAVISKASIVDGEPVVMSVLVVSTPGYLHICRNGSVQLQGITSVYLFRYKLTVIVKIRTYQTQGLHQ